MCGHFASRCPGRLRRRPLEQQPCLARNPWGDSQPAPSCVLITCPNCLSPGHPLPLQSPFTARNQRLFQYIANSGSGRWRDVCWGEAGLVQTPDLSPICQGRQHGMCFYKTAVSKTLLRRSFVHFWFHFAWIHVKTRVEWFVIRFL